MRDRKMDVEKKPLTVMMVTGILPEPNYSTFLCRSLQKKYSDRINLWIITDKNPKNIEVELERVSLIYDMNFFVYSRFFLYF